MATFTGQARQLGLLVRPNLDNYSLGSPNNIKDYYFTRVTGVGVHFPTLLVIYKTSTDWRRRTPEDPDYLQPFNNPIPPVPFNVTIPVYTCQLIQIGFQSAFGSPATASKALGDCDITFKPKTDIILRKSIGTIPSEKVIPKKEYTSGTINGIWNFCDTVYLLSSLLCLPSVAIIDNLVAEYNFLPNAFGTDNHSIFTLQKGYGNLGSKVTDLHISSLQFEVDSYQEEVRMTGEVLGTLTTDITDLDPDLYDIPDTPVWLDSIDIFVGGSLDTLTRLQDCMVFGWSLSDRYVGRFARDSNPSYEKILQKSGQSKLKLTVTENSDAFNFLSSLRNSTTNFLQVQFTGAIITGTQIEKMVMTFPFRFVDSDRVAKENIYSGAFTMEPIYDSSVGSYMQIVITNEIAHAYADEIAALSS